MIKRIVIVIVGIIVVVLGRGTFFYSGFYSAPTTQLPSYEHIVVPPAPSVEFSENISEKKERTILIDLAHNNNFDMQELNVLSLRLVFRGLTVKLLGAEDDLKRELLGSKEATGEKKDLKTPNAFIIVCPQREFTKEEKETIIKFVDEGGKLLLIADPTRGSNINNISIAFGLIFEPDYLYNVKENEVNYSNIFVTEFKENEITSNLKKIALYVAGSISSADGGIAFVDQSTFSSMIESRKQLSPLALVKEAKILGVSDLTFMTEPYNGILDNNQLIANIADWLASPIK